MIDASKKLQEILSTESVKEEEILIVAQKFKNSFLVNLVKKMKEEYNDDGLVLDLVLLLDELAERKGITPQLLEKINSDENILNMLNNLNGGDAGRSA